MTENESLSKRELEILQIVATGATNQQAAVDLDISVNTVKAHLRNIYGKLQVESRTEAVMVGLQQGLIEMETEAADDQDLPTVDDAHPESVEASGQPRRSIIGWRLLLIATIIVLVAFGTYSLTKRPSAGLDPFGDTPATVATGEAGQEHARWERITAMMQGRARFASATSGSRIFVIGGTTDSGVTSSVAAYDYAQATWHELEEKPTAATNINAAIIDAKIYCPGGYDGQERVLDTLEIYDLDSDTWSIGKSLPKPLCAYALTAQDGLLYLIGGWDGATYSQDILCYDPNRDSWSVIGQSPTPLGFGAAVSQGEWIYVMGGFDGEQELADCWRFEPSLLPDASWEELEPMETARRGHAAVASDGRIYVIGGGWNSYLLYNERYDPPNNSWSRFESPIIGMWHNLNAVQTQQPDGSHIYTLGGWDGTYLNSVESYQTSYRIFLPGS